MSIGWLIVIFAVLAVVLGSVIALVWWHLADVFFPGTAEKTGQRIFPVDSKEEEHAGPAPKVIDFGEGGEKRG